MMVNILGEKSFGRVEKGDILLKTTENTGKLMSWNSIHEPLIAE